MPLPHTSVDRLHGAIVEACLSYERSCRRRGVKLKKITVTYAPHDEGFDMKFDEVPYPRTRGANPIIPIEDQDVDGEDVPLPEED